MNFKKHLTKIFIIFSLFFYSNQIFAGIMEKPRRVYNLTTAHFTILFSEPSANTAKLVADNVEFMYQKACINYSYTYDQNILIIISPDSDELSVTYTNQPFNRIIIYDSVPDSNIASYKNGFLDLLNHEIEKAVASMVATGFIGWINGTFGNPAFLQPVTLMNVPFSFLEGAISAEDDKYNTGILNDKWSLQQLSQAKLEGKFPSLIQVLGTMDIYPGKDFCRLAASAFCAYIQQLYGYEKFYEYWDLGGQVNFFFLHKGIFEKVYEIPLEQAWQDFIETIPVPELAETDESEIFIKNSNKSLFKHLLHSQYGFIWYDELKGEVAIYDDTLGFQKNRRLLFLANDVTNLTLSPDGRFLVVSHTQQGSRENFKENKARVYDLQNRDFTGDSYDLREASLIQLEDGTYAIAGISVEEKYPQLKIIPADKTNRQLDLCYAKNSSPIFIRNYSSGTIPLCPIQIDDSKLIYIVNNKGEKYITVLDFISGEEKVFQISLDNEILDIKNLKLNDISFLAISKTSSASALLFNYVSKFQPSLTKTGMILLNKDNTLQQVIVQTDTLSGGTNDPLFFGADLYYSSQLYDQDEFRKIPISKINLVPAEFIYSDIIFPEEDIENHVTVKEELNEKNKKVYSLGEYPVKKFNPIGYMLNGSPIPFLPVKTVSLKDGIEQSPGLGLAFTTGADPFDNNELTLSAGFGFLPTDFTMIFNASDEEKKDFDLSDIKFFDDYTFAAYYKNVATPIDILASWLFTFNKEGEYSFDITGGLKWEVPLMMTFRRFTFSVEGNFSSSTTYWDQHQFATYPKLYNWPSFQDSYRKIDTNFSIIYSNIHQFGYSPYKKMGIEAGISLNADWDLNLLELQAEKRKSGTIDSVEPENLTQAIEKQLWDTPNAPTQINLGIYATAEIPQLLPVDNINDWIISLPTTIYAELFYTNGVALDVNFKTLILGKEIQDGFNAANLYFPRAGLYFGYDIQRKYDTNTVVLPDVRDFFRFYEAFSNTSMNDSIYFDINFALTPVIGTKLSSLKINTDLMLQYYLRSEVFALNFNLSFDL